jgi:hypothetical protein
MTDIFIAGSRQITRLPDEVKARIDTMIKKGFHTSSLVTPTVRTKRFNGTLTVGSRAVSTAVATNCL